MRTSRPEPIVRDLVLVGGGHAHVTVLRKLGMHPIPGLQVTLVSPDPETAYSGMLPGVVAGHYYPDEMHIELAPLCRFAGARWIQGTVTGLDREAQTISCPGRPDIPYDVISLDIGITPSLEGIAGAETYGIAVKPIGQFLEKWEQFLERARRGEITQIGFVGAGAGGVELCLAVHYRLQQEGLDQIGVNLFAEDDTVLPGYPLPVRTHFIRLLEKRGIKLYPRFRVVEISPTEMFSHRGDRVSIDAPFIVTRAASHPWLRETGLALDDDGFIEVRSTLQTCSDDNIFAVGDVASNVDHPRPKAGVFAVRQGPPLYRNLRRVLHGRSPQPFRPQQEFLSLISTGDRSAVAAKWGQMASGAWVWRWKDRIDRSFMDRFNRLPAMKPVMKAPKKRDGLLADLDEQMRCAGCGSKVAGDLLTEVLRELGIAVEPEDAAVYTPPPNEVLLHTVDGFRSFLDDPHQFGRVVVNHALSDIYAMGGRPVTALAAVTVPYATATKTRELLVQVMRGIRDGLNAEEVALVGGHTTEGAELAVWLSVNGLAKPDDIHRKGGLVPGDALILTKPLGTGALFAADMQGKARGRWIEKAVESMLISNRTASQILTTGGAHAMTDVTGFGLAGHLMEMLEASKVGAWLSLDRIPDLPGAYQMISKGIASTLQAGNERTLGERLHGRRGDLRRALVVDPQTAGGLLAGVPGADAGRLVEELRAAGYDSAAVVGEVVAGDVTIELRQMGVKSSPSSAQG